MKEAMRPTPDEYAPDYAVYTALVPEDDILSALEAQTSESQRLLASIDEARSAFRYEPSKWSIKQVIGHVTDGERIFGYRALSFARGEQSPLPGFDQDAYIATAAFDDWRFGDLVEEYALARRVNQIMFRNLSAEAWSRRGIASENPVTVRALAFIMVGHERHHMKVLRDRYGV